MGRNYSRKTSPLTSDLALIWDVENSDWRLTTLSAIQTLFEANAVDVEPVTQYSTPLTGATVALSDGDDNDLDIHLIITPAAGIAALTLTLPAAPSDKQVIIVNSTQIITTLTVDGNGKSVVGAPTTIAAANDYFRLKYDTVNSTWYRVG